MNKSYGAVVCGCSYGGIQALEVLLGSLKKELTVPVLVVLHISPESDTSVVGILNHKADILIKEAEDKELIQPGTVYMAASNYHLLVDEDETISLSTDKKVNYSRPSIDVLFETACAAYQGGLIGVIMTGANDDGAKGLKLIHEMGGLCIVEDPATALSPTMPNAAIEAGSPDHVLPLNAIGPLLNELV